MKSARDRLIVALDVPGVEQARALIEALGDSVGVYKIGLELMFAGGMALATELASRGSRVFLDAKLLDIEATVERATAAIARTGAEFLTVHAVDRKTLDAAVRGRGGSKLKLLGVTVLTNLGPADLIQQGTDIPPGRPRAASGDARQGSGLRWRGGFRARGSFDPRSLRHRLPHRHAGHQARGKCDPGPDAHRHSCEKRFPQAPTISWSGAHHRGAVTRGKRRRRSSPK